MTILQIKNRWTGVVLFEGDFDTMRLCVEAVRNNEAYLRNADLSGADLSGAFLSGAVLCGANLCGAYLRGANLSGADLSGAFLSGANLGGAYLSGADLDGASLSDANLSGADLSGAYLSGAVLRGTKLLGPPKRRALRADGYEFFLWPTDAGWRVQAGCRFFTFEEAWAHWCGPNAARLNTPLGDETQDILVMFSLALDREEREGKE